MTAIACIVETENSAPFGLVELTEKTSIKEFSEAHAGIAANKSPEVNAPQRLCMQTS